MNTQEKSFVLVIDASEEILKMVRAQMSLLSEDIKILGETDIENARYIFDSCHETLKGIFVGSGIASFTVENANEPSTLGFIREVRVSGWEKPLVGFSGNPDFCAQMYEAGCGRTFCQKGYLAEEIIGALKNHSVIEIFDASEKATV